MVDRVIATPEALALIRQLQQEPGELMFHQSGGCCDGSSPMCYVAGEFLTGDADVLLGDLYAEYESAADQGREAVRLANLRSPVHRLHPMAKLAVTFVFIICVISAGRYDAAGLSVYFFYPAVMIALGELPLWGVLRRTLPAARMGTMTARLADRRTLWWPLGMPACPRLVRTPAL